MEIEKHSSLPTCTNKETASPSTEVKSRDPAQEQGSSKGHKGKRVSLHCHNGQTQTGGSGRSLGAKLSTGQTGGHLPAARLFVMPRTRNSFPVSQARCGDATRATRLWGLREGNHTDSLAPTVVPKSTGTFTSAAGWLFLPLKDSSTSKEIP